jgi:hypothetical protein
MKPFIHWTKARFDDKISNVFIRLSRTFARVRAADRAKRLCAVAHSAARTRANVLA